jgi:hypothetical protein
MISKMISNSKYWLTILSFLACVGCTTIGDNGEGAGEPEDLDAASEDQPFSTTNKARILYVGDSLAAETRTIVGQLVQSTDQAQMFESMFPGLAICDFLEGKPAGMPAASKLRAQVRGVKPHLVILQFWGNAFTDCIKHTTFGTEEYYDQYFFDALAAVDQIEAGAGDARIARPRILWVLQGPDAGSPARPKRLNEGYADVASSRGGRTTDAGHALSMAAYPYDNAEKDRYGWTQFLPCTDFERANGLCTHPEAYGGVTQLHKDADQVHFCLGNTMNFFDCDRPSPGISRYAMQVAADARAWLRL